MRPVLDLPCPTCHGDGFVSFEDRHVENRTEVCPTCRGHKTIEPRTGETPRSSASKDGTKLYAE